jgi:transposase InsO family protein
MLMVSRQAFYKRRMTVIQKDLSEELVVQMVKEIRKEQPRIGGRKLYHLLRTDLQKLPLTLGRDKFFNLLKNQHLLVNRTKKYMVTTQSRHWFHVHKNLLKGRLITRPSEAVVADITYLRYSNKFCYLFLITDVYSRKIVGYHVNQHLDVDGALSAAQMALTTMSPVEEMIHHSDRGVQYCCDAYGELMKRYNIRLSMGEAGNPYDNAIAERVNGILKTEFLLDRTFATFQEAQRAVREAIDTYNTKRPHLSLGYMTPAMKYAA